MYVVFNELSVKPEISEVASSEDAKQIINNFVDYLRKLKKVINGIIIFEEFYDFKIVQDYGISEWLKDPTIDQGRKQIFRIIRDKNCFNVDKTEYLGGEFKIRINEDDQKSEGCLIAITRDERTVVSFNTNVLWCADKINGKHSRFDEKEMLVTSEETVDNLSNIEHLDNLMAKIKEDRFNRISSGYDLWEQREKLFPDIVFCERIKDDLYKNPERYHIIPVMKRLQRFQSYFSRYDGVYKPEELGLGARTESETVKNSELKEYRKFEMPNGRRAYFFDHISFTGKFSDGRIHFRVEEGKCYIGYIGRHLPTKKYK